MQPFYRISFSGVMGEKASKSLWGRRRNRRGKALSTLVAARSLGVQSAVNKVGSQVGGKMGRFYLKCKLLKDFWQGSNVIFFWFSLKILPLPDIWKIDWKFLRVTIERQLRGSLVIHREVMVAWTLIAEWGWRKVEKFQTYFPLE